MKKSKALYLVFWDNGEYVGGFEKMPSCGFTQLFNTPISELGKKSSDIKSHKTIRTFTESEWKIYSGGICLNEYLNANVGFDLD